MKKFLGFAIGLFFVIGFISSAEAIKIQQAEITGGAVVVKGNQAAKAAPITWESVQVTTSNNGGVFKFTTSILPVACTTPVVSGTPSGNAYYVAQSGGSDSNSCGQAKDPATPKQTIHSALSCLTPGATVYVKAGTYAEEFKDREVPSGTSWDRPVTIAVYPRDRPVLRPNGGVRVFTFVEPQQYIVIDGFVMDAINQSHDVVKMTCSGCNSGKSANYIRIQNSELMNAKYQGVLAMGTGHELINIKSHDNGLACFGNGLCHGVYWTGSNGIIRHSEFYNNKGGFGIHLYNASTYSGVSNNIVEGNFIHNNQEGMVISYGDDNIVQNNIVYNNANRGIEEYSETRLKLLHNTLWGNGKGFTSNSSDTVIKNNISDKGGGGQNTYTSDPQFVSVGTDFHLQLNSPAKTAGSDGGEVGAYGNGNTCAGPTW